eukprot:5336527-Amphidinium_carterae.1
MENGKEVDIVERHLEDTFLQHMLSCFLGGGLPFSVCSISRFIVVFTVVAGIITVRAKLITILKKIHYVLFFKQQN